MGCPIKVKLRQAFEPCRALVVSVVSSFIVSGIIASGAGGLGEKLSIWPPPGAIPSNAQFIVMGEGVLSEYVSRIEHGWPRMVGNRGCEEGDEKRPCVDEVPLETVASFLDPGRLACKTLRPSFPLLMGVHYDLVVAIGASSRTGQCAVLVSELEGQQGWIVTAEEDTKSPIWLGAPSLVRHVEGDVADDEGPLVEVITPVVDHQRVVVLAEIAADYSTRPELAVDDYRVVSSLREPVRFPLQVVEGRVLLSRAGLRRGMCYAVRFVAADAAGNEAEAPGGPILVDVPPSETSRGVLRSGWTISPELKGVQWE